MKIILEAFGGKLRSDPMDVPENTAGIFKMVLLQPVQILFANNGKEFARNPPLQTVCEFEYIGKSYAMGEAGDWPKIYVLKDIYKEP